METKVRARVTSKGQVTVPKVIRDALGLNRDSIVEFELTEDGASLRPVGGGFLARFASVEPRERPEDWDEVRKRVAAEVGRRAVERARE